MKIKHIIIGFLFLLSCPFVLCGRDLACATWNLKWFPSGRADERQKKSVESKHIKKCANFICESLGDATNTCDVIFCMQELRDRESVEELLSQMNVKDAKIAAISDFTFSNRPSWQQLCIVSTLPIIEKGVMRWKRTPKGYIPRGYVYAVFDGGNNEKILVFCVHLKSNASRLDSPDENAQNIYKREKSSDQILDKVGELRKKYGDDLKVIVAGDFNTNEENGQFANEGTFRAFYAAHFRSCFADMPKQKRITWPGYGAYQDATFDYLLYYGFPSRATTHIFPSKGLSDHYLVFMHLLNKSQSVFNPLSNDLPKGHVTK